MSMPDRRTPWIENLRFSVELYADRDPYKLEEVIARMSDLTMARNAYAAAMARWPDQLFMLCEGGRILKRSDRTN